MLISTGDSEIASFYKKTVIMVLLPTSMDVHQIYVNLGHCCIYCPNKIMWNTYMHIYLQSCAKVSLLFFVGSGTPLQLCFLSSAQWNHEDLFALMLLIILYTEDKYIFKIILAMLISFFLKTFSNTMLNPTIIKCTVFRCTLKIMIYIKNIYFFPNKGMHETYTLGL